MVVPHLLGVDKPLTFICYAMQGGAVRIYVTECYSTFWDQYVFSLSSKLTPKSPRRRYLVCIEIYMREGGSYEQTKLFHSCSTVPNSSHKKT